MAYQLSFVMFKPGTVQRRIIGELVSRLERKGLDLRAMKLMHISQERAAEHYAEHKGKSFFTDLIAYVTSGPVVAMVIGGEEAISRVRLLAGATKVEESLPGTIRGDYGAVTTKNIIHASDSPASAEREIRLFFEATEIVTWTDGNTDWIR